MDSTLDSTARSYSPRRLLRSGAVALVASALAACTPGVLDPAGPVGAAERAILLDSLAIMLAIVVPTLLAIAGTAWWFRASNPRARRRPDWAFSGQVELVVWAVPLMVIILLGGVTWIGAHQLDPARPIEGAGRPLQIQVVSLDWKWLFIYPDQHVAAVDDLVVPAGVPLHLTLTSSSVMNTFFVPQLGSMIYTMNGMADQLYLMADRPGEYRGLSGHFSGDGFPDMRFRVRALPAEAFAAWSAGVRGHGPTLDEAAYRSLSRQGVPPAAFTYGAVADGLFERIVTQQLPPGPGPAEGH